MKPVAPFRRTRPTRGLRRPASGTAAAVLLLWGTAFGQDGAGLPRRFQISPTVQVDRAPSAVQREIELARSCLADKNWQQWDLVIDALTKAMETSGNTLVAVTPQRLVNTQQYCQLLLASLPPKGLSLYRSRIDRQAESWYAEGLRTRDPQRLGEVVDRALASRSGDKALWALGEMALESGDPAAARADWERLLPATPPPGLPRTWPGVPQTDFAPAAVRARLVLASILEGSRQRAEEELACFASPQLHRDARGMLGGREVNYADALRTLLEESRTWPKPAPAGDWPGFAGGPLRQAAAAPLPENLAVLWRLPLPALARAAAAPPPPLSFHPVVSGDIVFLNNQAEILALDAKTGKPAWGGSGRIYEDALDEAGRAAYVPQGALGVPRFTLTVAAGKLLVRMGPSVTSRPRAAVPGTPSCLLCLELKAEGRVLWRVECPQGWAFEGSPLADAHRAYVALRSSDLQPQAAVAALDLQTGRTCWRQFVCAAETPGRGLLEEITHGLLTLRGETLYYNTNLGAVAALAARDGRLRWVTLYPRVGECDPASPAPHWSRDLAPCLYDRGTLYVAPADSRRIFALDAATGQILWQTGPEVEDAVDLLGVYDETLLAGGRRLYWIDLSRPRQGAIKRLGLPAHDEAGFGRGTLAGDEVWWPVRDAIYVFDASTARVRRTIDLAALGTGGGNLVAAGGRLLVATATELVALGKPHNAPASNNSHLPETRTP